VSFRVRLFVAILLAVLLPLAALALGVRQEMQRRLSAEYAERVTALVTVTEATIQRESAAIDSRLAALASDLGEDNRFRLGLRGDAASRKYLLDYAGHAMRLAGLSYLQLQDSSGKILSSGHFRNEFDSRQPELPAFLRANSGSAGLIKARTPEAPVLALVRMDSLRLGGVAISLIGGVEAEGRLLAAVSPGPDLGVALDYPGAPSRPHNDRVVRRLTLPFLDLVNASGARTDTAALLMTQSPGTLEELLRGVGRWVLVALALTLAAAVIAAAWLSSRISRPLRDLASKTAAIDLDQLDQNFDSDRPDEIGALSRLLGMMTERLRNSAARIREAERRAAVGDLARQINHDIKNGLAPIRNVLRHLGQVSTQDPTALPQIFEARRATLESSVEYLDTLARNYDRLSPGVDRRPCDINAIVQQVVRTASGDATGLRVQLDGRRPQALGDDLMIRRVLENLVGNALDSINGKPDASVTVSTEQLVNGSAANAAVRIVVTDTGAGMTQAELDRVFNDFYTTKPSGSGLGLSIVRRLILDLNGSLRVETAPGVGTRMIVELPALPQGEDLR